MCDCANECSWYLNSYHLWYDSFTCILFIWFVVVSFNSLSEKWESSMIHALKSIQLYTSIYLRFKRHFMLVQSLANQNGIPAGNSDYYILTFWIAIILTQWILSSQQYIDKQFHNFFCVLFFPCPFLFSLFSVFFHFFWIYSLVLVDFISSLPQLSWD
jgi:hypothetical protein